MILPGAGEWHKRKPPRTERQFVRLFDPAKKLVKQVAEPLDEALEEIEVFRGFFARRLVVGRAFGRFFGLCKLFNHSAVGKRLLADGAVGVAGVADFGVCCVFCIDDRCLMCRKGLLHMAADILLAVVAVNTGGIALDGAGGSHGTDACFVDVVGGIIAQILMAADILQTFVAINAGTISFGDASSGHSISV